ncbi:hypothetical protein MOO45_04045 [Bombilactobacillus folatiphilus]|uniref:Uncharacterized protein n=1 Tax=Bombilactobacillus folatiphilus TaxID=2923362 RepID=A0ABY4PAP5_9LACO|nr:hypothetical protein [Bombilactobacillus folatiphilus]UQS82820.1 hypothetical protein MOO45_04045 [Bombilactobacillus folatiphilus]
MKIKHILLLVLLALVGGVAFESTQTTQAAITVQPQSWLIYNCEHQVYHVYANCFL